MKKVLWSLRATSIPVAIWNFRQMRRLLAIEETTLGLAYIYVKSLAIWLGCGLVWVGPFSYHLAEGCGNWFANLLYAGSSHDPTPEQTEAIRNQAEKWERWFGWSAHLLRAAALVALIWAGPVLALFDPNLENPDITPLHIVQFLVLGFSLFVWLVYLLFSFAPRCLRQRAG